MICNETIQFAKFSDAKFIATLSRDYVEAGLGWSWIPERIIFEISRKDSNVIVTIQDNKVISFAVMQYLYDHARLNLFGVHPSYQRQGIGTRMLKWLEATALVNGNDVVYLETRLKNQSARVFYKTQGYQVLQSIPRYYNDRETGVRMGHDLWVA